MFQNLNIVFDMEQLVEVDTELYNNGQSGTYFIGIDHDFICYPKIDRDSFIQVASQIQKPVTNRPKCQLHIIIQFLKLEHWKVCYFAWMLQLSTS